MIKHSAERGKKWKFEAAGYSEMFVTTVYQTARSHVTEHSDGRNNVITPKI
jgi:hypothetical protein